MFNFYAAQEYREKLYEIHKKAQPRPASEVGAKECQRSGICCWRRPCDLYQGDVERLAAHLDLSPKEVFNQYLVVDFMEDRLRLLPRRVQQAGGTYLTDRQTFDIETPCVFYNVKEQACGIHDVKPHGGALWHCGMRQEEVDALPSPDWTEEALMAYGWDGDRW